MVGSTFLADHTSGLDDGYEGADRHTGGWFRKRRVACRDLFFETEEERATGLGCSHGGRRGGDTTATVSRCRADSWHFA